MNDLTNKRLISKIYKQHNIKKKKNTTQSKTGQKTWTDISPKKSYKWAIGTWKDAQHH